jgi:hypothetical protein
MLGNGQFSITSWYTRPWFHARFWINSSKLSAKRLALVLSVYTHKYQWWRDQDVDTTFSGSALKWRMHVQLLHVNVTNIIIPRSHLCGCWGKPVGSRWALFWVENIGWGLVMVRWSICRPLTSLSSKISYFSYLKVKWKLQLQKVTWSPTFTCCISGRNRDILCLHPYISISFQSI